MDTTTITTEIAARVTAAMAAADINRMQLANATGIARTTLNRSLAGGREFTVPDLIRIGKVTGNNLADFLPLPDLAETG